MANIADFFGKASIDNNYAVATTVKTTRTVGVTVLEAFDLSKYTIDTPVFFVTYKKTTDPVTGDVSVTNLVSWKGLVNVGANTITNLTVAPGYADAGNAVGDFIECIPTSFWENSLIDGIFVGHNPDGTFKLAALKSALGNDGRLVETLDEITSDFVLSGGVWSLLSGLNGQMTALAAYIDGYKNTVALVATRAFTISKDTYIDVLRNTGTNAFSLVYTEVANGAAAPVLAANSLRLAKVVTNASTITSVVQLGSDSLSNLIYPSGVNQKMVVIRQDATTNAIQTKTIMISGWGYLAYNTGAPTVTNTVALPVKFLSRPIVTAVFGGDSPSQTTYGSGANSVEGVVVLKAHTITTNSFVIQMHKTPSSNFAAGYGFYQWFAVGEVLA